MLKLHIINKFLTLNRIALLLIFYMVQEIFQFPSAAWYPGGPSCSFFPYPVADVKRPWGGHVTDVSELLNLYAVGKALRCPPRTEILADFHKSHSGGCTEDADVSMLAKKCLLSTDDVKLWLQHLTQVSINRKRGAEKAQVTREKQYKEQ